MYNEYQIWSTFIKYGNNVHPTASFLFLYVLIHFHRWCIVSYGRWTSSLYDGQCIKETMILKSYQSIFVFFYSYFSSSFSSSTFRLMAVLFIFFILILCSCFYCLFCSKSSHFVFYSKHFDSQKVNFSIYKCINGFSGGNDLPKIHFQSFSIDVSTFLARASSLNWRTISAVLLSMTILICAQLIYWMEIGKNGLLILDGFIW